MKIDWLMRLYMWKRSDTGTSYEVTILCWIIARSTEGLGKFRQIKIKIGSPALKTIYERALAMPCHGVKIQWTWPKMDKITVFAVFRDFFWKPSWENQKSALDVRKGGPQSTTTESFSFGVFVVSLKKGFKVGLFRGVFDLISEKWAFCQENVIRPVWSSNKSYAHTKFESDRFVGPRP
jgi:hypothetical protein